MSYSYLRPTSRECETNEHGSCSGIARYMEQDGLNDYTCQCGCHRPARDARERREKVARLKRDAEKLGLRVCGGDE